MGANAVVSASLTASIEGEGPQTTGELWIGAKAEVDPGIGASVEAATDAEAGGDGVEVTEERLEGEIVGDRLTAFSFTTLRASLAVADFDWADQYDGWVAARWSAWIDDWLS